jgi:pilus assembly protein CpaD
MSETSSKMSPAKASMATRLVLAAAAVALLSGCAKRDSVTVGAIPDDYRTNHPIVLGEKEEKIDLPVAASARGATVAQRASLEGFLSGYDRSAAPPLTIVKPSGSANAVAAADAAKDFAQIAKRAGVPAHRIMIASYQASADEISAPVRVSFRAMRAQTGPCGRWPADVLETSDNKHYANFGCSYQNNMAAQISHPEDLLGPRKQTPIDADNRGVVIGDYQDLGASGTFSPNIDY